MSDDLCGLLHFVYHYALSRGKPLLAGEVMNAAREQGCTWAQVPFWPSGPPSAGDPEWRWPPPPDPVKGPWPPPPYGYAGSGYVPDPPGGVRVTDPVPFPRA